MAGDPSNATLWQDGDVYVADNLADLNFDGEGNFSGDEDQHLVGLLDGETGFNHTREMESNDRYAWGGSLVRTTDRNIKHGFSFTALEDNVVTRSLAWPGSTDTEIRVARPAVKYVALRVQEGGRTMLRISRRKVRIAVDGEIPENEADVTTWPFAATVYPDGDKVLWDRRVIGNVDLSDTGAGTAPGSNTPAT